MSTTEPAVRPVLNHPLRRMLGRDPHEKGRVATNLELLFDLAFAASFGIAGNQMAHLLAEGRTDAALLGFGFGLFAISWAWINFTWFSSAFDTDDWLYRLTTLVQMVGVVVVALGLSDVFHSIEGGHAINNKVLVAGYVVMRVAMLTQWLRLAAQSPQHRAVALTYALWIAVAQVGWIVLAFLPLTIYPTLAIAAGLMLVELVGPIRAERGGGTPWHPHHISERYGLLVIIALGEGVLGTIASVQPIIAEQGWSGDAIVLVFAGILLTFGMWWAYFSLPWAELLHGNQRASFLYGYLHILIFGAVAAVGAGLHVAAYVVEGTAHVGFGAAVRAVAVPVAVFLVVSLVIVSILARRVDRLNLVLCLAALGVLVLTLVLTSSGTPFALDVLLAAAAPWVFVVGFELVGHRRMSDHLVALDRRASL